jgi:hypothetical protein
MLRSRYSGQRAAVAAAKNATLPPEGLAPSERRPCDRPHACWALVRCSQYLTGPRHVGDSFFRSVWASVPFSRAFVAFGQQLLAMSDNR